MKKTAILFALLVSVGSASQQEFQMFEVKSKSRSVVLKPIRKSTKLPIAQRRSPLDALNGKSHPSTAIVTASNNKNRHRNPLDALRGDVSSFSTHKTAKITKRITKTRTSKKQIKQHKSKNIAKTIVIKPIHVALVTRKQSSTIKKSTTAIIKQHIYHKVPVSSDKTMYLTFDDGPLTGTDNILRILNEEGIDATMFFVGLHVQRNKKLFNKALSMPRALVANHTYTHANDKYEKFYNDKELVLSDIDKAQKLIGGAKYLRLCGRNVWRLPTVNMDDFAIRTAQRAREISDYDALEAKGYQIYGWDIEWEFDHSTKAPLWSAEEMANKIELRYTNGHTSKSGKMILLAHDYMFKGEEGAYRLKELIGILKSRGWKFAAIDNYAGKTPDVFVKLQKREKLKLPKKKEKALVQFPEEQITIQHNIPNKAKKKGSRSAILASELNDAIRNLQPSLVRSIIRKGADVNALDLSGNTPLNTAVRANNIYIVKTLVRLGARINNRDSKGASPILIAKRYNRLAIGTYLINQLNIQKSNSRLALKTTVN